MQSAHAGSPAGAPRRGARALSRPARPLVLGGATALLVAGVVRVADGGHALFPTGAGGWGLALLTAVMGAHLLAMGRERWWGGSGSGAALTLAVLLLHGWVPAALVSLTLVTLTGAARRGSRGQAALHGACDLLGIGAAALVLALFGTRPTVSDPWEPAQWRPDTLPELLAAACVYLLVDRLLLWWCLAPPGALPTRARAALSRQCLLAVSLLGIAPLIVVVAVHTPLMLPLFALPLIALDSTLWIARARAVDQLLDPLTGLPNRRWLLERVRTALRAAERDGGRCALILIDLDRFRSVNDTLGHLTGDRLLLRIAERMARAVPATAETARLGGDEFAVLLPRVASVGAAQRVAREVVAALA
ncbi:GGDEF domain-containing protein, partial [Streptomyces sp. SM14]|uniref:GGDEF domain-containing protein n=1 Tax=Streptomyces sp. SM14 TaxID=1736045 RepID=UPI0011B07000